MEDIFWSEVIGLERRLCVSTLSREAFEDNELENIGNDFGYFIYEIDDRSRSAGILVLAKAASEEAAMRLVDLFRTSRLCIAPC